MQETWLLLSSVLCVSQSDLKIILLEITHLLPVIQDKATKKSRQILLFSLLITMYLKTTVSSESRF